MICPTFAGLRSKLASLRYIGQIKIVFMLVLVSFLPKASSSCGLHLTIPEYTLITKNKINIFYVFCSVSKPGTKGVKYVLDFTVSSLHKNG